MLEQLKSENENKLVEIATKAVRSAQETPKVHDLKLAAIDEE